MMEMAELEEVAMTGEMWCVTSSFLCNILPHCIDEGLLRPGDVAGSERSRQRWQQCQAESLPARR